MARGFNTTLGSGNTDDIATAFSANSTTRSTFIWVYLRANALNPLWRQDGGTGFHQVYNNGTGFTFHYNWSGSLASWSIPQPSMGVWNALGTSYDNGSVNNNPVFYLNQTKPTVTLHISPLGTPLSLAGNAMRLGNDIGLSGAWDGMLADFAMWSVILTDAEFFAMAKGIRPYNIRPKSLLGYWPIDGLASPEPDLSGLTGTATVTGTLKQSGPAIAMFTPRWPMNELPSSAPSAAKFRRTASRIGTRTGTRQTWAA